MKSQARGYPELREYCDTIPIIDCHDHSAELGPKYTDPIQVVTGHYMNDDLASAVPEADVRQLLNAESPWEERWPILEAAWQRTCHTGYAQVTRRVLKKFYDEDDVTLPALRRMQDRLIDLTDEAVFDQILDEANIVVRLEDVWPHVPQVLDGSHVMTPRGLMTIPLPAYHRIASFTEVQELTAPLGRAVTSLDEYLDACREIFEGFKAYGAVAFKDQSAYTRALDYGNPSRAEAEAVFNWFMADTRRTASYPDQVRPLDDYVFHAFMRMARDMELPVQLHTGHYAGLRGDITKANAVQLASLFHLHSDVLFDVFHANWPYGGEALFLVKNFPNVSLGFCWTHIIDPLYSQDLLRQALSSVPHGKIHGYGSDFLGYADRAWAHVQIAKDNIAIALADSVEADYIDLDEAKSIARAWLFDNPNRFYRLGL